MSEEWPARRYLELVGYIEMQSGSAIRSFFLAHELGASLPKEASKPSKLTLINAGFSAVQGDERDALLTEAADHFGWQKRTLLDAMSDRIRPSAPEPVNPPQPAAAGLTPVAYVPTLLPVPQSRVQQSVLQSVWDHFLTSNLWPTFSTIDKKLFRDERIKLADVAEEMPKGLLQPPRLRFAQPNQELTLSIAGVSACRNSEEDVATFLKAVRYAAELWLEAPDDAAPVQIDRATMAKLPGLPAAGRDQLLTRLGQILGAEGGWGWSTYSHGQDGRRDWTLTVDARVRDLLDLTDLEHYWSVTRPAEASPAALEAPKVPDKIFLVHGHDPVMHEVARFLQDLTDQKPIILDEQPSRNRTIIEKFEEYGDDAAFAVVLLTPDDVGRSIGAAADRPRARQNVVFELGYFCGRLGRDRVAVLEKDIEWPSDVAGLVYISLSAADWKQRLNRELRTAGLDTDLGQALG